MTSKVTAKLPLGVAFSMLLISLALFVGCKQEVAPQDSYTPPGYGATVGYLTDTTWKSGNETIKFGAEGSVSVPDSMKKMDIERYGKIFSFELGDFTYSVSGTTVTISAKVKKVPELPAFVQGSPSKEPEMPKDEEFLPEGSEGAESEQVSWPKVGDIIEIATCTIGATASSGTTSSGDGTYGDYTSGNGTKDDYTSGEQKGESNGTQGSSTSTSGIYKYYQMKVSKFGEEQTFTMENRPTSGDKFVGTYYNGHGVKQIQINKDNTFVRFTAGGKDISYWKDNEDGTISVSSEPFTNSSISGTSSTSPTIYYLYPHALRSSGNTYYK